jgi:uncharacterized protein
VLGDARQGKLAGNITAFGRALRRAGVAADASRMALAQEAALAVGLESKADLSAAFEAVLVSKPQDIAVFRELFDAFFRNPDVAQKLLSQMLPQAEGKASPNKGRPRVREALAPQKNSAGKDKPPEKKVEFDAAMSAGRGAQLRHADFNQLTASEYALVLRLATQVQLAVPQVTSRRYERGARGSRLNWARTLQAGSRTAGELALLHRERRARQDVPLLVMVDVSGSMERYARLLLAFLHAATRTVRSREVFAFGTELTDLGAAFKLADTDAMLKRASTLITDFAGGTKLGEAIAAVRTGYARKLVGKRTLVLLITDGLETGDIGAIGALDAELAALKRKTGKLIWLNPLLRFEGYAPLAQGAAVLHRQADSMLAVHNIESLNQLARALAQVLRVR